ncbi:MAG: hypothetical protein O3A55_05305, partial [Bacteroidetes bacterium]|nr:hypothetical protein [Bacteroidota bacterium]
MKINKSNNIIVSTILVGILALILKYFKVSNSFLIWEFELNWKIILIFATILIFNKTEFNNSKNSIINSLKIINVKKSFTYFLIPLVSSLILILIGMLFNEIKLGEINDTTLFIFGIIFDAPAILFFSLTTILLEEILFRIIIFDKIKSSKNILSIIYLNTIFVLFNLNNILYPRFI